VPKRFFEFMTHDERVDCLCHGDWAKHPSGTVLLRKGAPPDGLRVLLKGEAEVRIGTTILARLDIGDVFGEISFILERPATADVVASTEVSLLVMKRKIIDRLVELRPHVAGALYRSLVTELARRLSLGLAQWKA
jgi:CRP-like cAMP-binding protein